MRTAIITLSIIAIFASGIARASVTVGDKLHLSLITTGGMSITTPELKGHLLVVDFWATWCHPCMHEVPHMVALYKKYTPLGVGFLGVSLDDDLGQMQSIAKSHGIVWPQVFQGADWHDPIVAQWGVRGIPDTFLIGPDGTVLWKGYPTELGAAITNALQKHPTQAILQKQTLKILAGATEHLIIGKDFHSAIAALDHIPLDVHPQSSIRGHARKLAWQFYKTGQPAVTALLSNSKATTILAKLVGGMGRLHTLLRGYR